MLRSNEMKFNGLRTCQHPGRLEFDLNAGVLFHLPWFSKWIRDDQSEWGRSSDGYKNNPPSRLPTASQLPIFPSSHLPTFPPLHPFNKHPSSTMLSFIYEAVTFAFFLIIFFIILTVFLSSSPPSPTPNPIFTPLPGQHKVASSSTQPMGYCGWARIGLTGWSSLTSLSSYQEKPWTAITGTEKRIFYIHPFMLCKASTVFEARVKGIWKNVARDALDWSKFTAWWSTCTQGNTPLASSPKMDLRHLIPGQVCYPTTYLNIF